MSLNPIIPLLFSLFVFGVTPKDLNVDNFVPNIGPTEFVTFNKNGKSLPAPRLSAPGPEAAAQFVKQKFGLVKHIDYVVKSTFKSNNGVTHTHLKQLLDGREIVNSDFNINIRKDGTVDSYGNLFHTISARDESLPADFGNPAHYIDKVFEAINFNHKVNVNRISVQQDLTTNEPAILKNIPGLHSPVIANQKYIRTSSENVEPGWEFEVDTLDHWYNAFVDLNGKVVSLVDWVHEAHYSVFPIGTNDPEDGPRQIVTQQGSSTSSPKGWHDLGDGKTITKTSGNNVLAVDNRASADDASNQPQTDGGSDLNFDFPIDYTKEPETYTNASVTNLFYICNMIHDIYYAHGFNEAAGNFQQNNFDKGGKGGDRVLAQAQDGSGKNNANFATPPDGKQPRMRMYLWNTTSPSRDGDLDNGIIIHEYTHGLSNRLTGGPDNGNCLISSSHSGGMGEGWSDMMATIMRTRKEHTRNTDFGVGNYVYKGKTIRQYPYSTSNQTNPETFVSVNKYFRVHQWGAVWAEILYEVYWNLIDKLGFSPDLLSGNHQHGNTLFLRLLIDGMKLQPCNPGFIQARDAIIKAEENLTNGAHKCDIWKGFAKRGMGTDAACIFDNLEIKLDLNLPIPKVCIATNGFKIPDDCKQ